jgi:hypothetical protein
VSEATWLDHAVRKWAEKHFVGLPVTSRTLADMEIQIRAKYADYAKCDPEMIVLRNFRVENGAHVVWDGAMMEARGPRAH